MFAMNLLSITVILLLCGWMLLCNAALRDPHCPFISLSSHSPLNLHTTNGSSTIVYQIFLTEGSAGDLNISWSRSPYPLQPQSRYHIDSHVINDRTLNASLIIRGAQLKPDQGNYTVTAANECMANSNKFYFQFSTCEAAQLPKPFQQYNETIITESPSPNVIHLSVAFHGPVDLSVSVTAWNFESIQCVETGSPPNMFRCNRTIIDSSIFTADLWIYNASYTSTGQYTVQAISTVGLSPPNNASVNLYVVRQPRVRSCNRKSVNVDLEDEASFECEISNFSDFTSALVLKNDRTWINQSTNDISIDCWHHVPDNTIATCTVRVTTSKPSRGLQYKLCVGYNGSVIHRSPPLCSDNIAVSYVLWELEVAAITGILLILLLSLVAAIAIVICRKKQVIFTEVSDQEEPIERQPLISSLNRPINNYHTTANQSDLHFIVSGDTSSEESTNDDDDLELDLPLCAAKARAEGLGQRYSSPNGGLLKPLSRQDLVCIAELIVGNYNWKELARHLGLEEAEIAAIEQKHPNNIGEQQLQILLIWYQAQPSTPSAQILLAAIEEKCPHHHELTESIKQLLHSNSIISMYHSC